MQNSPFGSLQLSGAQKIVRIAQAVIVIVGPQMRPGFRQHFLAGFEGLVRAPRQRYVCGAV